MAGFFFAPARFSHANTPPETVFPEGCTREVFTVASASMGREIPVCVLLPPGDGGARLPVLYALHGRKAPMRAFSEMIPLREFLVSHPMIVVSFQADEDSGYIDATARSGSLFTKFFFEELIPRIAGAFPTDGRIAVTGFSMGGYGALHYLLERPELFTSASAMSGAFELFDPKAPSERKAEWHPWHESLLGGEEENAAGYERAALAPRLRVAASGGENLPPLLFVCGSEDFLRNSNRRFVDLLSELNAASPKYPIRYEYRELPGRHEWAFWKGHIDQIAEFHWRHFEGPPATVSTR